MHLPSVFEQTSAWLWALTALVARRFGARQLRAWLREVTASRTSSPRFTPFHPDEGGHAAENEGNHDSGNRPSDETIRRESGRVTTCRRRSPPGVYGLLGANGAGKPRSCA